MNAMYLGTQRRQIAEENPSHGFHPFAMARGYCRARVRSWLSVFAAMAWVGLLLRWSAGEKRRLEIER